MVSKREIVRNSLNRMVLKREISVKTTHANSLLKHASIDDLYPTSSLITHCVDEKLDFEHNSRTLYRGEISFIDIIGVKRQAAPVLEIRDPIGRYPGVNNRKITLGKPVVKEYKLCVRIVPYPSLRLMYHHALYPRSDDAIEIGLVRSPPDLKEFRI